MLGELWNNKQINKKNMMKTKHLIPLTLLSALAALGACISPQDEENNCQVCDEQQIVIKLASDNAPATRAGRPLTSNEPNQDVDRVMLIVCKADDTDKGRIVYTKLLDDWMTNSEIYIDQNDRRGREDVVKLSEEEQLPKGHYTAYAIAYTYKKDDDNNQTQYTVKAEGSTTQGQNLNTYCEGLAESHTGNTFTENFALSLNGSTGEELFAGSADFTVTEAGFTARVVLNRQVAGIYLYVKDIPYYEGLAKLRLMPAADNDGLVLGKFANEDIAQNGNATKELYVMNGTDEATSTTPLCEIDLKQWFSDEEIEADGSLVSTTKWQKPDAYRDIEFVDGSFFSGSFVIPFAASANTKSLEIQLTDANGTVISGSKTWTVSLPASDLNKQDDQIYYWGDNGFTQTLSPSVTETTTNYSLLRNHLYCIGSKSTDEDEDEPQILFNQQEILLEVIAEWDYIYDMALEPTPGGGTNP